MQNMAQTQVIQKMKKSKSMAKKSRMTKLRKENSQQPKLTQKVPSGNNSQHAMPGQEQ